MRDTNNIINKIRLYIWTKLSFHRQKIFNWDYRRGSIIFVLVIYFLSILLNLFQFVPFNKTVASEAAIDNVKIVAVIVDKDLYTNNQLKDKIQRYSQSYIQKKVSDTKAIVFPINKSNFKAKDIVRILENLYLEWQSDYPSTLEWVILVWDLPLPVVNNNWFIFPSIYPYVDFVDKKFIYDQNSGYFTLQWPDWWKPEIWHWIINLEESEGWATAQNYISYFDKLQNYNSNPWNFVDKKFWYDDFINIEASYSSDKVRYYLNKFIFLEDLSYHRYTKLLFNIMNIDYLWEIKKKINTFQTDIWDLRQQSLNNTQWASNNFDNYTSWIWSFFDKISKFQQDFIGENWAQNMEKDSYKLMPTLTIKQSLETLAIDYQWLFGEDLLTRMRDNVLATWRWDETQLDYHVKYSSIKDNLSTYVITEYNKILEKTIDAKIQSEKMYMKLPVFSSYELHELNSCAQMIPMERYENFYFWKNAKDIKSAHDFSIFRWHYLNIDSIDQLSWYNYNISKLDDSSVDLTKKSVGGSYGIMSRQVEANRWFNTMLAQSDADVFNDSRCSNKETVENWSSRYYGWASPLNVNVTQDWFYEGLKNYNYKNARNPSFNKNIGGWIFDLWGSKMLQSEQKYAYSYEWYKEYSSVILTQRNSWWFAKADDCPVSKFENQIYCRTTKVIKPYSQFDFFSIFNSIDAYSKVTFWWDSSSTYVEKLWICRDSWSEWELVQVWTAVRYCYSWKCNIVYDKWIVLNPLLWVSICPDTFYLNKSYYDYNLVDTRIYNKSSTSAEVSKMNLTTPDRPINDPRYTTFQWVWWTVVKLEYPDFFNVEVFSGDDAHTLKSIPEINLAVKDYLIKKVRRYNEQIKLQNDNRSSYYNKYKSSFDVLNSVDILANPNRQVNMLDDTYLISSLWEENIERIASNLYYLNIMWPAKMSSDKVLNDIDILKRSYNINSKIKHIISTYLSTSASDDSLINPWYTSNWYEAWFINSDGEDSIDDFVRSWLPEIIGKIDESKRKKQAYWSLTDIINSFNSEKEDAECWVDPDGSVIIWQWPAAISCRLSKTLSKPFQLTIDYSCSECDSIITLDWTQKDSDNLDSLNKSIQGSYLNSWEYFRVRYWDYIKSWKSEIEWENYKKNRWTFMAWDNYFNNLNYLAYSDYQKYRYNEIKNNLIFSITPSENILLDYYDDKDYYELNIDSMRNLGNLDIAIAWIGNNCIYLDWKNLCETEQKYQLNDNLSNSSNSAYLSMKVDLYEKKSWVSLFQIKVCDEIMYVCYFKNKPLYITPWKPKSLEIITPTDNVIKWWKLPFHIQALDKYFNPVWKVLESYYIKTELWRIWYNWLLSKELNFTNFNNAYFVYDSSNLKSANTNQDKLFSWVLEKYKKWWIDYPVATKTLNLVEWVLNVSSNNNISNWWAISYKLPDSFKEIYNIDTNNVAQLNVDSLIPINLSLQSTNWLKLNSIVNVKSTNSLMLPWIASKSIVNVAQWKEVKSIEKLSFKLQNEYFLTWWNLKFYLHPSFVAWNDKIIVSIPWLQDFTFDVKVSAWSVKAVDVQLNKSQIDVEWEINGKVLLIDIWGNTVTNSDKTVRVWTFGSLKINSSNIQDILTVNWVADFKVLWIQPWGKSYVYTLIRDLNLITDYSWDYEIVSVKNTFWPKENVNIMYLNLFWNDWWNLWWYFSSNKRIIPNMINSSEKMLTVTTQLINPSNIKNIDFGISSNLKINNPSNKKVNLTLTGWNINILLWDGYNENARINIWAAKDYNIVNWYSLPIFNNNTIFYFPQPLDSFVTSNKFENNSIFINNQKLIDFGEWNIDKNVQILLSKDYEKWYNKWSVMYSWKLVWNLYLYRSDKKLIDNYPSNLKVWNTFGSTIIFGEWSTNWQQWLWVYSMISKKSYKEKQWYNSIENSINPELNIWFRADMQSINNFANWNNVWESTIGFASEFLVNFWDPLLTRINDNEIVDWTNFDKWIWKQIFSDSDWGIVKVVGFDYNGDDVKDLAIWYSDWTIRLLKNYRWTDPYQDMWELMVIADWLKDLFAWDVDGDWYDDLIVKTAWNKVRVYINKWWVFEIDWRLVCLDVPWWPDNLDSLSQIFWEDMDKDWKIDIVTNDLSWDIKIFYWWATTNWFNYLSNDYFSCDSWWKDRQQNRVKLVDNYSIQLDPLSKIQDESLVHRYGLLAAIPNYWQDWIDTTQISDVDVAKASQIVTDWFMDSAKFQSLPNSFKPVYENIQWDIVYAEIFYLTWSDPVNIYKTFEPLNWELNLQVGDLVRVNVNIEANYSTNITYLEKLRWPWSIPKWDKVIEWFDVGNLPVDVIINPNTSNGIQFMVDNIQLRKWDNISFSYIVVFKWVQATKIKLDDTNNDTYTDIIANPTDACLKTNWINESKDLWTWTKWVSNNSIAYNKTERNIQAKYDDKKSVINKKSQDYFEDLQSKIDNTQVNKNIKELWLDDFSEEWNDESLFEFQLSAWWVWLNLWVLDWQFESVQKVVENSLKGLCKWFKFDDWTCGWIPVPFNMAFLAPWEYNVFGCKLSDDPWTPVFWYPWTMWITCGDSCSCPIPMPNMKTKLWPPVESAAPSWCKSTPVYMSNIRMYLSPTLTQWMWVAVCYWPYQAWMKGWPNPAWVYMWNCVVAWTNFDVFECKKDESSEEDAIDDWQFDLYNIGSCKSEFPDNSRVSPLYFSSNSSKRWIFIDESPTVIEQLPDIESSFLEFDRVALKPWKPIDLKIESWDVKWIVQCMIRKWVDRQIRYIINNLTNMTIYLYLPDVSQLVDDFSKVDLDKLSNIRWTMQDDLDKIWATWNSVSKDWKALGKSINSDFGKQIQEFTNKYTPSKWVLNKVSDTFNNPFRSIQEFFEEVPLIDIETREINIQVPFISQENILKQIAYLENRVVKQKQIINDWEDSWKAISWNCDKANDPWECNRIADGFLTLKVDFDKLIKSVEQNIDILDSYKEFPQKLYEWLHVSDRYLSELLCIIDEFLTSIMWWLEENAQRFEKWVDVIILIIGIMETWQILVDFSVDWRSSCSKCRKDEYDYYSCKMSLLCPDLPILPIPPFKIPDIYLDFSHIDLWINLLLPEFIFTPMDIPLLKLPDLPRPPAIWFGLNVILPKIPLLPALPELPEIPSFLPTIKLELPYLPPAPKIPELLPEVSGVLKILEFIGYLYCIIKQWIWLVAEWNVKTRIEQLTQRTNRIEPFDFLKLTMIDPPLAWYDIRVDSYVRLRFEFEMIYNLAQSLADSINEVTNSMGNSLYMVQESIWNLWEWVTIPDIQYELEIDWEDLIQPDDNKSDNWFDVDNYFKEYFDLESFNMTGTIEYAAAYDKLMKELKYFTNSSNNNTQKDKAEKIIWMIDNNNKVSTNINWLNKVKDDLSWIIANSKNSVNDLANMVLWDYDKFLETISWKSNYSLISEANENKTISVNLFNVDPQIYDKLDKQEHPLSTYFELNTKVVDRYIAALDNNLPQELNMDNNTYENNKEYLKNLKSKMQTITPYFDASNINENVIMSSNPDSVLESQWTAPSVDLTQYIKWFYTKWTNWKYLNVINWEEKGTELFKNNNYDYSDYDGDWKQDILLWDDSHVYIKYWMPYVAKNNVVYWDYYETQIWDSPIDLRLKSDTTGRITIKGKQFKVWDDSYWVSNFKRDWQSYENITVSWNDSQEKADAYLIELTTRADVLYDKYAHIWNNSKLAVKYILVTPTNETYDWYSLYLRNNKQLPVKEWSDILQISQDNFRDWKIQILINKIDRRWLYMKVTNLYKVDLEKRLYIKSPWSNQISAWRQVWADRSSPTLEVSLIRKSNWQSVSNWFNLNWLINTNYNFSVNWVDNWKVKYSWIEKDKLILTWTNQSNYNYGNLYLTWVQSIQYKFWAIDHVGNATTQTVNLNIKSPDIQIENVDISDPAWWKIFTKLTENIENWTIRYQRNRYWNWESLTWVDLWWKVSQNYQLPSDWTRITWQYFQLSNKIKFDDWIGNEIWTLDADSWEIQINQSQVNNYKVWLDFTNNKPSVLVQNSEKTLFRIDYWAQKLLWVTITNWKYDIINNIQMKWVFDWGSCIRKPSTSSECLIFVSKLGEIFVPSNYKSVFKWLYRFDNVTKSIEYDIQDDSLSSIVKIIFEPKPFR